jgi:hypothetical protein
MIHLRTEIQPASVNGPPDAANGRRNRAKENGNPNQPTEKMQVVYSPRFKAHYDELPPSLRAQFQLIDAQVIDGNLSVLRQNAWVYYVNIGGGFIAWGSLISANEFYWRDVDLPAKVPVVL